MISPLPHCQVGDIITIIGKDRQAQIMVEELANNANTISNEILSRVGQRLPKIYYQKGVNHETLQTSILSKNQSHFLKINYYRNCSWYFRVTTYFQWTRIQLILKGYNLTEQTMILSLDDQDIKTYLQEPKIAHLETWNTLKNQQHYLEYITYQKYHPDISKEDVVTYIDTFYQNNYEKLKQLHYPDDIFLQMMETASIKDFDSLIQQNLDYQQTKPFLSIKGMVYQHLNQYIQSQKQPLQAVLSISYPFIDSHNEVTQNYLIVQPNAYTTLIKKDFKLHQIIYQKILLHPIYHTVLIVTINNCEKKLPML